MVSFLRLSNVLQSGRAPFCLPAHQLMGIWVVRGLSCCESRVPGVPGCTPGAEVAGCPLASLWAIAWLVPKDPAWWAWRPVCLHVLCTPQLPQKGWVPCARAEPAFPYRRGEGLRVSSPGVVLCGSGPCCVWGTSQGLEVGLGLARASGGAPRPSLEGTGSDGLPLHSSGSLGAGLAQAPLRVLALLCLWLLTRQTDPEVGLGTGSTCAAAPHPQCEPFAAWGAMWTPPGSEWLGPRM